MERLFAIFTIAAILSGCDVPYSEGDRTGVVQKISKKGLFWKTYEGQLVMDGFKLKGSGSGDRSSVGMTNIWEFSVADPAVAAKVNDAAKTGQKVTLSYEQVLLPKPWVSSTGYRITGVSQ